MYLMMKILSTPVQGYGTCITVLYGLPVAESLEEYIRFNYTGTGRY